MRHLPDHDPGDAQAPDYCRGPILPCDQTVMCGTCGLAWWGEGDRGEDLFEVVHQWNVAKICERCSCLFVERVDGPWRCDACVLQEAT